MSDQDIIDTIAAHRIQTAWHGKHDGWWECTCQGGEFAIPWTPEHVLTALRSAGYVIVPRGLINEAGEYIAIQAEVRLSSDLANLAAALLDADTAEADQ